MPTGGVFTFGPYRLDAGARRLTRAGKPVDLSPRQFTMLHLLVSRPGEVVTKNELVAAVWKDVAVSDSSLVKIAAQLREVLDATEPDRFFTTIMRRGYRFDEAVTHEAERPPALVNVDEVLGPYRGLMDGRAAIETLRRPGLVKAREIFQQLLLRHPDRASFHVGLANACVLLFESTRAEQAPDVEALRDAVLHAREACRLEPTDGEAWATLGFVLARTPDSGNALPALRHAIALEPDNWRHHLRLAFCAWGEERLRAARRVLALLPGCPLAHWLVATVFVARGALGQAEAEIDLGIAAMAREAGDDGRFAAVALWWLKGLLCLARGAEVDAIDALKRELALEQVEHLYTRECCANAWYAIGVIHRRRDEGDSARSAIAETLRRVPAHPRALAVLAVLSGHGSDLSFPEGAGGLDVALAQAILLTATNDAPSAADVVATALAAAPEGNAGWLVPIEPMLRVDQHRAAWAPVLATLRTRAS